MAGNFAFLILSLTLAASCGLKRGPASNAAPLVSVISISGNYESTCSKNSDSGASVYLQGSYSFSSQGGVGMVTESITSYLDPSCIIPSSRTLSTANYSLVQFKTGTQIQMSYTTAQMQPLSEQTAVEFRSLSLCDLNNWQLNTWTDVFSHSCIAKTEVKWLSDDQANHPGTKLSLYSCAKSAVYNASCSRMILVKTN